MSGACLVLVLLLLPETCKNIVGNGTYPPPAMNKSPISCLRAADRYAYTGCGSTAYCYLFYLRDEQILIDIGKSCRSSACLVRIAGPCPAEVYECSSVRMYERTNLRIATETRPARNISTFAKSQDLVTTHQTDPETTQTFSLPADCRSQGHYSRSCCQCDILQCILLYPGLTFSPTCKDL
jgi:hypothetical protein